MHHGQNSHGTPVGQINRQTQVKTLSSHTTWQVINIVFSTCNIGRSGHARSLLRVQTVLPWHTVFRSHCIRHWLPLLRSWRPLLWGILDPLMQWRIQGAPPACTPLWVQILSFWHTNFSKRSRLGSWRPPYGKSWIRYWANVQNSWICFNHYLSK